MGNLFYLNLPQSQILKLEQRNNGKGVGDELNTLSPALYRT